MTAFLLIAGLCFLLAMGGGFAWWNARQRRVLVARLAETEKRNHALDERIEKTKAHLLASENARRNLEVSNAVSMERERIMREIHDGIGSGLVAALASAERHGQKDSTAVFALKGALADLKIAVDSLESVEGNVATLLASLRYRLEPELKKSGVEFVWRVEDVPQLDWLDSPNALHVLRIFQETITNIIAHAEATIIDVGCRFEVLQGRPGILITMSDNGKGYDADTHSFGHGRKNIKQRAEALDARLEIESKIGKGSRTALWLPLIRSRRG